MANYRIDELELNWLSDGKYSLKATVNADKDDDNEVFGTVSGQELVFYPGVIKGDKKIVFKCNDVDFSNYKADQFLLFSVFDNYNIPAEKKKKGGIVIRDTIYPPPGTVDKYHFSERFTVKKLSVKRVPGTYKFTVNITCDHAPDLGKHKLDTFEFRPDVNNNDYQVMIFNINEKTASTAALPVTLSATNIEFDDFPVVLPFFTVRKGDNWDVVDIKKGTIYIE